MKKVLLWGTGQIAELVWTQCQTLSQYELLGVIDNNREKQGGVFKGLRVYSPEILDTCTPDFIVVLTNAYDEIYGQIISVYPEMKDRVRNKNFFYAESILQRYRGTTDPETIEVIDHIKEKGLEIFNYDFAETYKRIDVETYFDHAKGMFYVIHSGKPLYFSKELDTADKVINYYRFILLEQDVCSPHRYLTDDFDVSEGDVVVDAGAAEGNFALQVIEKASKVYLIEADGNWVEALKETFKEYSDKVVIIQKFLSSYEEGCFATLDTLIHEPVHFVKMDIEGSEWDALEGARNLIHASPDLKCAICSYHSDFDRVLIEDFMDKNGLRHFTSGGLIWFPWTVRQNYVSTRLNKAIVRGIKRKA